MSTEHELLRFTVIRPPLSRLEHPHVIVGPFSLEPGTPFQRLIAQVDSPTDAVAATREFMTTEAYVGRSLRGAPLTRRLLRALPRLLELSHSDDRSALLAALTEIANQWPGTPQVGRAPVGDAALWDGVIAVGIVPDPPAADVADLADMLRVQEAVARLNADADPAAVVAALTASPALPGWLHPQPGPGSPAARGIRPVGVSDLLLIKERLLGYRHGELSYVENVLRAEKKERTFRRLDRTFDSYTVSTEEAEESERDLQSTTRSDLQTEISETASQDASLTTGLSISASYGPFVSADTSIEASLGTSMESATSMSQSYAQDVVDRSVIKVAKRTRETAVQRVLAETEETSLHGFDNVGGSTDIVGYYRWLEQIWQAQVLNYGRRMIMEFMVPRPAALWLVARDRPAATPAAEPPPPLGDLRPDELQEGNYLYQVERYKVTGVTPPPPYRLYVTKTVEMPEREHQKSLGNNDFVVQTKYDFIQIPDGYVADYVWADHSKKKWDTGEEQLRVHVANQILDLIDGPNDGEFTASIGPIDIAVFMYDFKAATVDLKVRCTRTDEAYAAWQLATYEKVVAAYQAALDAYNTQVEAYEAELANAASARQSAQSGLSPDAKRQIEREELKRCALNILTGQDFSAFDAVAEPTSTEPLPVIDVSESLTEARQVRFGEQAFEWINSTYVFYPYFWSAQDGWFDALAETDTDPVFQSFLRAGYARVQVPVRPGFERSVLYYLYTGRLWRGGEPPLIGDESYLPIVEELAEATGMALSDATPYGEPWTYRLPTTLVALDNDVSDIGL